MLPLFALEMELGPILESAITHAVDAPLDSIVIEPRLLRGSQDDWMVAAEVEADGARRRFIITLDPGTGRVVGAEEG